jgi:4-hydroxybenzoyl-CoA thioesterase
VTRGDDLICESVETRIFCMRDAQDRRRIHGIPVPDDIRRLCE